MKGRMKDLLIFHEHHDFACLHEAVGQARKDEKCYNGPTDTEQENVSNIIKEPASSHVKSRREDDWREAYIEKELSLKGKVHLLLQSRYKIDHCGKS
jgi:hypothetical protein